MTKLRALQNRIEGTTGVIWGLYELPETFCNTGYQQPQFYVALHGKESSTVRIEGGFSRRGFYLSWGHRTTAADVAAAEAFLAAERER